MYALQSLSGAFFPCFAALFDAFDDVLIVGAKRHQRAFCLTEAVIAVR